MSAELCFFWRLWGTVCFFVFSSFERSPVFLVSLASRQSSLCFHCHVSFSDSDLPAPTRVDPCDYITDSPGYSAHPKILKLTAKFLLPCKVTYSQAWGIKTWISSGDHYSTHQSNWQCKNRTEGTTLHRLNQQVQEADTPPRVPMKGRCWNV